VDVDCTTRVRVLRNSALPWRPTRTSES